MADNVVKKVAAPSPSMKLMTPATPPKAVKLVKPSIPATDTVESALVVHEEAPPVQLEAVDTAVENVVAAVEDIDQIVATAAEIENLKEDKAFKAVPALLADIDRNCFRLGGVLSRISQQAWFMDKGYENFRAYIEAETELGYRKAMYLIGIYNGLVESGVKWSQVAHLGWTKLKDLAPHLTTDNVDEWVAMVAGLTTLQIQDLIKSKTAGVAKADSTESVDPVTQAAKVVTLTFKLHEDQKATIREALDKCKHELGTDVDTVALEHIALDYLGGESKIKTAPTLLDMMTGRSAEEVLGVFEQVFPTVELSATLSE